MLAKSQWKLKDLTRLNLRWAGLLLELWQWLFNTEENYNWKSFHLNCILIKEPSLDLYLYLGTVKWTTSWWPEGHTGWWLVAWHSYTNNIQTVFMLCLAVQYCFASLTLSAQEISWKLYKQSWRTRQSTQRTRTSRWVIGLHYDFIWLFTTWTLIPVMWPETRMFWNQASKSNSFLCLPGSCRGPGAEGAQCL